MGFGALLSPLIADPFLSEANCFPANSTANTASRSYASRVLSQHHASAQPWSNQTIPRPPPKDATENHVSYAFWIMALINVSDTGACGVGSRDNVHLPVQLHSKDSSDPRNMPGSTVCRQEGEVTCRNHYDSVLADHKKGRQRTCLHSDNQGQLPSSLRPYEHSDLSIHGQEAKWLLF